MNLTPARTRAAWWSFFGALIVAEAIVWRLPLSHAWSRILSDASLLLIPILLTVVAGVVLTSRLHGVDRRFWGLLTVAVALEGCSEAYWTYYAAFVDPRGPMVPHWLELGQLAALGIFLWLVMSMTALGDAPWAVRARFYLDVACMAAVLYAVSYWWLTLPLFVELPDGRPAAEIAALYPVIGVLLLFAVALMTLGWKAYSWRTWERLATAAFTVYGVGMILNPWLYAALREGPIQSGFDGLSAVMGFGYYLLFMAMVYRWTEGSSASPAQPWGLPDIRPVWLPSLYPVIMWLALVALGLLCFANGAAPESDPLIFASILLGVLLVARSWLSGVELAHHRTASISDTLTGAFNQRYFGEQIARAVADARESGRGFVLLIVDVVDLSGINSRFGRDVGDRVLRSVAQVLQAEAPGAAPVSRLARDDFALIIPDVSDDDLLDLAHVASARVSADVELAGTNAQLAVGIARFPEHGDDAEALQEHAHSALRLAGAAEFTDVVIYDPAVVEAADPLQRLARERVRLHRTRLRALATAVDRRYADTGSHSDKVGELACALALVLELPESDSDAIESAARLHDLGMIGVPDDVMLSGGSLSAEGRRAIREHPVLGERMLRQAQLETIAIAVRHHHERWDGSGYPDGKAGEEIPFASRILALCDAFDAMTSPRTYRAPRSVVQAIAEIKLYSGAQFDPAVAEKFVGMVSAMKSHPVHDRATGRPASLPYG